MARKLVIVESPTKAKKIAGYLGPEYEVQASVGHIRDLPQPSELPPEMKKGPFGKFAVNVDADFEPYYVVYGDKKAKVRELKKALKEADELYLATDEDREGEAIAWHLLQELQPKIPVKRMVFNEITKEAITKALKETRDVDQNLVNAQETRRILDRLYGYEVSPVLWRKVRQGLSAGRVQSVATRLVVERERARMAFVSAEYWDVIGDFAPTAGPDAGQLFPARLQGLDGKRVASGRDFDSNGQLTSATTTTVPLDSAAADSVVAGLNGAAFRVGSMETKPYSRRPAPPFTTSTLQQEASRKLRMNARDAMRTAQSLYENGYITYMRTDSPALSTEAISAARTQAAELYGPGSIPGTPRVYKNKSKNAQEAHEAIRPAGDKFKTPNQLAKELTPAQLKLYDLIWKRTIASQMIDAKGETASVRIAATLGAAAGDWAGKEAVFAASGTVITERGFLAAYEEGRDADESATAEEGAEQAGTTEAKGESRLPRMAVGDSLEADGVKADGHATTPPPRYTEASLVKALEELGIGRPSTYAATISTIQDRGYVRPSGQALVPSWLAFSVTKLMEDHFDWLVRYEFTAKMEADLDEIAAGDRDRLEWLKLFYFGDGTGNPDRRGIKDRVENLPDIDAVAVNSVPLGDGLRLRVGRFGPYVEDISAEVAEGVSPPRASVPETMPPDELTADKARELISAGADAGRVLGVDPESGHEIVAKGGRYGPYVTEVLPEPELDPTLSAAAKKKALAALPKPRTASLFKDMDLATVTLEDALKLMSLPRVVGIDPETQAEITAQNGRYGPYLKKGTDSRTLAEESMLFTITLDQALAIYAEPKRRGARGAPKPPLRELGEDPTNGKPIVIKDGRFGPYITDGETNRTVPRELTVETITPERAIELLAEKRAAGPTKRRTAAKKPAAKSTATKTTAAKTTTKTSTAKSTASKSTASKSTASKSTAKTTATKTATAKKTPAQTTAATTKEVTDNDVA